LYVTFSTAKKGMLQSFVITIPFYYGKKRYVTIFCYNAIMKT